MILYVEIIIYECLNLLSYNTRNVFKLEDETRRRHKAQGIRHKGKDKKPGSRQQIRRSAVSIPSNIAEGYGRNSTQDYIRFLQIACGSLYEIQTQLEIAVNLGYLENGRSQTVLQNINEIERMLSTLIKKLTKSP